MKRLEQGGDIAAAFRRVHFIGVGGVGMSGIAEVLCTLGYDVSGSDLADGPALERLREAGAQIFVGHRAEHLRDVDVVVTSSAIAAGNPELLAARQRRIPVVPRAEMLAELMRFRRGIAIAGTHGKTTTTSLVASVLSEGGLDPTFVIGGQLLAAGRNAGLGQGEWLVAEADESDGSFLRLNPLVAVVTNIDADHLENYGGDFARVQAAFSEFLHRLPFYGLAVLCIDDDEVRALAQEMPRHVVTYGLSEDAEVRASALRQQASRTDFLLHLPEAEPLEVQLSLPGRHNVQNALAAAAIGYQLGIPSATVARALGQFQGVGRRFNLLGDIDLPGGGSALLVDDYGHHPRELEVVFEAAREGWPDRRLVVAFQPHRYSRTRDLLDEFAAVLSSVDALVLTEVYPAGEAPIVGADGKSLARAIRSRGRIEPVLVANPRELASVLPDVLRDGDILILLGAGDIGRAAQQLARHGLDGEQA
ncbi:UDP-N-acetylmuramate--L-alanine ligase [Pseudomarimonas salicorniae]|uniref:UDP-N-acetylmuramate--L-alanine ligase n=1 Tax=Pseudomarimonas salicorniae TaxID=2933270 RepID=A0ABT0GHE3_9GAMM|nr:UDP-N-acetylmuramate--L-alanine ligase [Lysobacter sp. CAU 1642]MCK7593958.1 UDP-N-acetylmuramate--L-alanine ligase [Lysobacter sp. CAU 1642]